MNEIIEIPNEVEMKAAMKAELAQMRKAMAMSDDERMAICDMGFYNDTIKGYLIAAMREAEFSDEDIRRALNGVRWALSEKNATEAAEVYRNF